MRASNGYRAHVSNSSIAHKFMGMSRLYRMLTMRALKMSVASNAVMNKSQEYENFLILNLSENCTEMMYKTKKVIMLMPIGTLPKTSANMPKMKAEKMLKTSGL